MPMLGEDEIRGILDRHGLSARRSLGQNFVVDPQVVERIAELARVGPADQVVEIGPGLGSLTLALHATGARVVAIEKDRLLVPVLREVLAERGAGDVEIIEADALSAGWAELLSERSAGSWSLVANLPYNVAVPLILSVLADAPLVERLVVMVQREVAERLVATAGGRVVGIPSIKVGWYASAELLMSVPPESFVPRPRVESAVVGITRRPPPSDRVRPERVFALVDTAYRQRRKMLRSTLGGMVSAPAFAAARVDPTARPEQLDVVQWARLAEAVQSAGG